VGVHRSLFRRELEGTRQEQTSRGHSHTGKLKGCVTVGKVQKATRLSQCSFLPEGISFKTLPLGLASKP